jgi:flagellar FliL protein
MASSANTVDGVETPLVQQPTLPVIPLLIAVVLAVLFSAALLLGGAYFMVKSGRLSLPMLTAAALSAEPEALAHPPTHALVLEPMVANLADPDGKGYLRLSLTLRVEDVGLKKDQKSKEERPTQVKGANEAEAAVRDTALEVLGHQTAEKLLAPDGKEHLKAELKMAITGCNRELKVDDIYFTEFLVQR